MTTTSTQGGPGAGPEQQTVFRGYGAWSNRPQPCIRCAIPTHLRDTDGQPAHIPCRGTQNGTP
ncbi:hypothetical protein ACFXKG_18310 [Streptomyces sp. NPDC059255]|uniref:hypothetical protein n=1 Tax=Streptomyces sp. NPDC059255 TaxID=3346793 RepID=UPI00369530F9